jgi:hypothetical protein
MTKRYGSLVGAVKQLATFRPTDMAYEKTTDHVLVRDTILLAAAAIADTISLGFFGWETMLNPKGDIWFDALGASTTLSVGDVTHNAALAAATSTAAAGSFNVSKTITIDKYFQPLWQQLGYADLKTAQAVGQNCELLATIAGAAATGNVTWQFTGQPRI